MAFIVDFTLGGYNNVPATEVFEGTASETITIGETLVLSSGKLTKASGTTAPKFVALSGGVGGKIYVHSILPEYVYKTTFSADGSSIVAGDKVTIGSDGASVTATTTSGVATVYKKLGSGASGTAVLVRFC